MTGALPASPVDANKLTRDDRYAALCTDYGRRNRKAISEPQCNIYHEPMPVTDSGDLLHGRQLRNPSCLRGFSQGLDVFGVAVVNKHSDIVWVVAITIWHKSDLVSESRENDNGENLYLVEVVAYFGHRHEVL